jgi:hypothetical protein
MDVIVYKKLRDLEKATSGFDWSSMVFNNIEPIDGAAGVNSSNNIILEPFNIGWEHEDTNIQIARNDTFTEMVIDYTAGSPITSYAMPTDNLEISMVYFWRYRYKDSYRGWCKFSEPTRFITASSFVFAQLGDSIAGGIFVGEFEGNNLVISTQSAETTGNWYEARDYAAALVYNGYDDWVIPTHDEFEYIYGNRQYMDTYQSSRYWASIGTTNVRWYVDFSNGEKFYIDYNHNYYVRPIRRIPINTVY